MWSCLRNCARGWVLPIALLASVVAGCARPDPIADLRNVRRWEDGRTLAGDSLLVLLHRGSHPVRAHAARAIGRIGDPAGLHALNRALRADDRADVRREAAFALGILGHPDAAPMLAQRLDQEHDAEALGEILLALGRLAQPGSAQLVIPYLESAVPYLRERAAEALALIEDPRSLPALLEAVDDPVESVVWRVAYALEKLPGDAQVDALLSLCSSTSSLVRRYAVRSLGRLEATRAQPVLSGMLETAEEDWRLRVMIADGLGRLGDESAIPALIGLLADEIFHVRVAALQALARLDAREALELILELRTHPTVDVRAAAYESCAELLGSAAFDTLWPGLEDISDHVAATCLQRLGACTDVRAVPRLIDEVRGNRRPSIRYAAVEGLARAGERAPIQFLRAALSDSDWVVRAVAAEALGQLDDVGSVDDLLAAYDAANGPGRDDVRWQILRSLGELGDPRAEPLLRNALGTENDVRLRLAAREALEQILPAAEVAQLPTTDTIRFDVHPVQRSPEQPARVTHSRAQQLVLQTDRGRIVIDLFGQDAPQSVESFARLAEDGFFDGLHFHRVVPNFVVQGGDPRGNGWGDAGYLLRSEWSRRRYERGTVGIATSGKDTGSCQLFITHSPQPHLDARYTIIGQVVVGMEVVETLQRGDRFRAEPVWAHSGPD